jgi:hypothetical protein
MASLCRARGLSRKQFAVSNAALQRGREFFSQFLLSLTETRCARFSAPADVITFSGLIYLTTDHQSTSLETFKKDNMRSRLAA